MTNNREPFCFKPALALVAAFLFGQAAPAGDPLPRDFSLNLEAEFLAAARLDPLLARLADEAVAKAGKPSFREFLSVVRLCPLEKGQAARVADTSEENIVYLTRELVDGGDATGASGGDLALRQRYLDRALAALPAGASASALHWSFAPDMATASLVETKREICILSGKAPAEEVEYLAHEMIHYSRAASFTRALDPLLFANSREYALKTAQEPGDEVDAYLFEYSLRARLKGKRGLEQRPFPQTKFTDNGSYLGTREEFARFIIDDLGYQKSRFAGQYQKLLKTARDAAGRELQLKKGLLASREAQEREYGAFVHSRFRIIDRIWPAYRAESEKGRAFQQAAAASRERLEEDIPRLEGRIAELKKRLKSPESA